jgi:hypothetical protein
LQRGEIPLNPPFVKGALPEKCHSEEPFALCHSERSEESKIAQGKLRDEESKIVYAELSPKQSGNVQFQTLHSACGRIQGDIVNYRENIQAKPVKGEIGGFISVTVEPQRRISGYVVGAGFKPAPTPTVSIRGKDRAQARPVGAALQVSGIIEHLAQSISW